MPDFSVPPGDVLAANAGDGYTGLYFEQGVPILDRDLNLLQDLIVASVRSVLSSFVGNGVSDGSTAFAVGAVPAANDVVIRAGTPGAASLLVDGIEVRLDADVRFSAQLLPGDQTMTTPATGDRIDVVYLDLDIETVEGLPELANPQDVGMQTSVRLRPRFRVLVAPGPAAPPEPTPGHHHYTLAQISRQAGVDVIGAGDITDLRQTRVNLAAVAGRVALVEQFRILPAFDPAEPFTPSGAQVNQPVTLNGRNFDIPPVTVTFGGVTVPLDEVTPTSVRLRLPANLPSGNVTVGISTGGGSATAAMQFAVAGTMPAPIITGFSPESGDVGILVTITGQNFNVGGLDVRFGAFKGTNPQANADGTSITAGVPAGAAGPVTIAVITQGSGGTPTQATATFLAGPQPAFTRDSPGQKQFDPTSQLLGQQVIVSGQHLDLVTKVFLELQSQPPAEIPVSTFTPAPAPGTRLTLTLPTTLAPTAPPNPRFKIRLATDFFSVTSDDTLTISSV